MKTVNKLGKYLKPIYIVPSLVALTILVSGFLYWTRYRATSVIAKTEMSLLGDVSVDPGLITSKDGIFSYNQEPVSKSKPDVVVSSK